MNNVSVIIPSLYEVDGEYLKLCVESLRESGFGGQIIVVTNGVSAKPYLGEIKGISIHLHTRDQGQCNAVNIGAQIATGDYLLVSNADMYYAPEWDKNLEFEYPVFSPNLVEPTDNLGSAPPFMKFAGGLTIETFNKPMIDGFIKREVDKIQGDEDGFNLPFFIQREFWQFLGGYDPVYDPWGSNSDTDLQTRINLAGVTPMRLNDVLVYHFSNKSGTFELGDLAKHQAYQYNWDYFHDKFGFDRDELGSDVWYNKDMIPKDPKSIKYKQVKYES